MPSHAPGLSPEVLRERFNSSPEYYVGIEDEVMLLDPATLELAPRANEVLALLEGDRRFKLELPASQLEIVTDPCETVAQAAAQLLEARRTLVAAVGDGVRIAAAGAHPFSPAAGPLNRGPRYDQIAREYGWVASRQLVCALQVHVSIADAGRALAVYNAARSYLPHLAALAANAPFYEGADTGLASIRPKIAQLLPRQGVPPPISSWSNFAEMLSWRAETGALADHATWWWELRPHPSYGTLEFRVPDGQSSVSDVAAIAAVAQALVAWLGERHDGGETLLVEPSWRIEENRWSACRHGVEGELVDPQTGRRVSTREALGSLLEALEPVARACDAWAWLRAAARLIAENGAIEQRRVAAGADTRALTQWLAERFLVAERG